MGIGDTLDLDISTIRANVKEGSIGNYWLFDGALGIRYVGRSDTDLQSRLLRHVDESPYKSFKFSYAASPKEAYYKECEQYHRYIGSGKLMNKNHPDSPDGMSHLCCPVCYLDL